MNPKEREHFIENIKNITTKIKAFEAPFEITAENERDKLYYLKYKTSNNDSSIKYIFGDIYYEKKTSIKRDGSMSLSEGGFYKLEDLNRSAAYQSSSFFSD